MLLTKPGTVKTIAAVESVARAFVDAVQRCWEGVGGDGLGAGADVAAGGPVAALNKARRARQREHEEFAAR